MLFLENTIEPSSTFNGCHVRRNESETSNNVWRITRLHIRSQLIPRKNTIILDKKGRPRYWRNNFSKYDPTLFQWSRAETRRGLVARSTNLLFNQPWQYRTSRDRPKSAPYPRLKNSKKTSKCQVFVYSSRKSKIFRIFFLKKLHTKKMDRVERRGSLARAPGALTSHNAEKLKGGTLWGFSTSILSQNMKKLKKKKFYFREKISQCRKKLKGGTLWDFPTSIRSQNIKKMQGGDPLRKKNFEKNVSQCRKKLKGGTLWSRPVWYVTRKNR